MSKEIFEDMQQAPAAGAGGAKAKLEKQARQLAYDTKYKVKQALSAKSGGKADPAAVAKMYLAQLAKSPAPPAVKALAKKKLMGEEYVDVKGFVVDSVTDALLKVFVEKKEETVEEVIEEEKGEQKFHIKVTDKKTGNTYHRYATRAKIAELRANPNIATVEMSHQGESKTKAKKDYDGDGKVESGSKEHAGAVHNAIQRKKGGVADGQDTRKEEVIYEKEDPNNKKLDTMKGKNNIKINPSLGESIRAELDALKAVKIQEQEAAMKQQEDEKKKEALADQQAKKDKMMKLRILQNKMRAVRGGADITASHEMQGDTIAEGDKCEKCGGDHDSKVHDKEKEGEEDPRGNYTKMNLTKNKLRAMGLKMSHDMEGEMTESAEDRLRDQRMERGGVDGNVDYRRPPRTATGPKKKPSGNSMSAFDKVVGDLKAKYGDKAIMAKKTQRK